MKIVLISAIMLFAFAAAELIPSNSYLPPSPVVIGKGYSQIQYDSGNNAGEEIIADRNAETKAFYDSSQLHGGSTTFGVNDRRDLHITHDAFIKNHKNGFTSLGNNDLINDYHKQEENGHGEISDNAFVKHSLEDVNEPVNYNFEYMVHDYQGGTDFGHHEEKQAERAQGEYHVVLPDGRKQIVSYQTGERGFKPQISYENTDEITRSGYDSNANSLGGNGYYDNGNNRVDRHNDNADNRGFTHLDNENNDGIGDHGNGNYNNA